MRKKRLLATLAVIAGLGVGGAAGLILGVPGVSGAQTTTTVPSPGDSTTPTTPGPTTPGTPAPDAPDANRPPHDDAKCPNMGGESDGSTDGATADGAGFRRGPGSRGGATIQSL